MSIITTDLVAMDVDAGADKEAVIGLLAARLADAGRSSDGAGLVACPASVLHTTAPTRRLPGHDATLRDRRRPRPGQRRPDG